MTDIESQEQHILILAPLGKDAVLARQTLLEAGMGAEICRSMRELVERLKYCYGSLLVTEEAMDPVSTRQLIDALRSQEAWSDLPIVLLASRGESNESGLRVWKTFAATGNVTILERPVRTSTLLSALQVALRSRRRQYQVRKLLSEQVEAMRLRDEFMSIAGHELRTPITSLKLQTQITQRLVGKDGAASPDRLGKFLKNSDLQLNRLSRLVEDMLDVARINSGKFTLNVEEFDLAEVVPEVVDRFAIQLANARIKVSIEIPPCRGNWDRYRFEQVLNNLLTNAIKYAPGAPVKIVAELRDEQVRIVFTDQGPGVASGKVAKLFDRFERATTGSGITGLGLGLYICRQIIEAHGGRIDAESDVGRGMRFVIDLPRLAAQTVAESSAS